MTIASELEATQTYLTNTYNKIAAKGGTAPENKNMANLADAVDSIPTGGGGEIPQVPEFDGGQYGVIAYLDANNTVAYYTATSASDLRLSTPYAYIPIKILPDGYIIYPSKVLAYSIGSSTTSLPSSFLNYCDKLRALYGFEESSISEIGSNFLNNCHSFDQPLTFPSTLSSISDYFLAGCYNFNKPITIPSSITNIGSDFLQNCHAFDQPLTIPSSVTGIGGYFMFDCWSFTGTLTIQTNATVSSSSYTLGTTNANAAMYVTGVTLAGVGAQRWKTTYNDKPVSPYRKLILAAEEA